MTLAYLDHDVLNPFAEMEKGLKKAMTTRSLMAGVSVDVLHFAHKEGLYIYNCLSHAGHALLNEAKPYKKPAIKLATLTLVFNTSFVALTSTTGLIPYVPEIQHPANMFSVFVSDTLLNSSTYISAIENVFSTAAAAADLDTPNNNQAAATISTSQCDPSEISLAKSHMDCLPQKLIRLGF